MNDEPKNLTPEEENIELRSLVCRLRAEVAEGVKLILQAISTERDADGRCGDMIYDNEYAAEALEWAEARATTPSEEAK